MKKFLVFAVSLVAAVMMPMTSAFASTTTPNIEEQLKPLFNEIERIRGEVSNLENKVNNQSPAPEPTEKPAVSPKVKLLLPTYVNMGAGASKQVELKLQNIGNSYAKNMMISTTTADAPISAEVVGNTPVIGNLAGGQTTTVKLNVKTDQAAKTGSYSVTLNYFYTDENGNSKNDTDTFAVKVDNPLAGANVRIYDFTTDKPVISAGDNFTLHAVLENTNNSAASDVQIMIEGLDPNAIHTTGDMNLFYRELQANAKTDVNIAFYASPKIKPGAYPITFKLKYRDVSGTAAENSFTYYLNMLNAHEGAGAGDVQIVSVNAPTAAYEVGNDFPISIAVRNTGTGEVSNVKVTAVTDAEGAIVPKSANIQMQNKLAAGEGRTFDYKFAATAKAKNQSYVINFKLEYETGAYNTDGSKEVVTVEQYAGVNIINPAGDGGDTAKVSKPRIIISQYESDPVIVKAGREFDLKLTFQNTHRTKTINNIKIVITALETTNQKGSVFTPVNGSNTLFIDEIKPLDTIDKTIFMYTVPDASPRSYTLSVKYKYQDEQNIEYDEEEQIGINVKQITKLETSEIMVQPDTMMGQPVFLNFSIINSGKVNLSNLRVDVEGNFDVSQANTFMGTIRAGNNSFYEGSFTPNEPGEQKGKIIISCEDDMGEPLELTKEFKLMVNDFQQMEMSPDMMMNPEMMGKGDVIMMGPDGMARPMGGGFSVMGLLTNPITYVVAAVVVIVVIVVIVLIVRKRKKNRMKRLEQDE